MANIHESKDLAEQIARNLRCCGVTTAYVKKIVAYEVIIPENKND